LRSPDTYAWAPDARVDWREPAPRGTLGLPKKDGTTQKAFTIYAWNEFGEGGIVAPTKGSGTMMLEAIKKVLGTRK
jgi:hypothetical protein